MLEEITIVVPTRNEAHNIVGFINAIPAPLPLVIVDDSEDDTAFLIGRQARKRTTLLRRKSNVTEARQLGAEVAQTNWLLFTDADVIFSRDYFQSLSRYLVYDAVFGPKLSSDEYSTYYRWFTNGQILLDKIGIPAASGSNLLVRRAVFQDVGGFDMRLTVNEDSELAWRIKRASYTVKFAPDLVVFCCDHRRLKRGVIRKTVHSLTRCMLLYSGLMPTAWRGRDWGYWSSRPKVEKASRSG